MTRAGDQCAALLDSCLAPARPQTSYSASPRKCSERTQRRRHMLNKTSICFPIKNPIAKKAARSHIFLSFFSLFPQASARVHTSHSQTRGMQSDFFNCPPPTIQTYGDIRASEASSVLSRVSGNGGLAAPQTRSAGWAGADGTSIYHLGGREEESSKRVDR